MASVWRTSSEISEALARYESKLRWQRPRLHGIGFADEPDTIMFVRVNEDEDVLAAAVLAAVTGWHGTTGSVRLGKSKLAKAVKRLAPAEAERANLQIWREIHGWYWSGPHVRGGSLVAVFDADPDQPSDDPYVNRLREVVGSGRQATPENEVEFWPPPEGRHRLQDAWRLRWPQLLRSFFTRRGYADRWVRFHSLPESKRYADTPLEYETILHRHNTVLKELVAQGSDLQVITLEPAFSPVPRHRTPVLEDLLPDAECWLVMSWPDLDPTLAFMHAYVSRVAWQPGRLDELLRRVADDELPRVVIAPSDLAWVYGPYDGGADVLLDTPDLRDRLRDRYSAWLSSHPGGL
ncbi:hypothetical protein [Actinoplanes sp. NBRC 101535]|uniref:DUF3885 domain-containing protein n=1 Tax=Actinoplanes sp. NBRC 101535 TaxID=3032196 RepID=UPI0024A45502|nr:hypothetical protein [Actinoplanes sp. NBRC 101535]GLY04269.1 hypothetical protein Acsp01_46480 [Actinoplanes sp. NBRC 101535]